MVPPRDQELIDFPIHDSQLVARPQMEVARKAMHEAFTERTGGDSSRG
jgi:hypothetical protein